MPNHGVMTMNHSNSQNSIIPEDIQNDLLREFLVECNENLASLDQLLVRIESNPDDIESLKVILRVFHSVKGV